MTSACNPLVRSAGSIRARSVIAAPSEAGQMAASDYVPIFFKDRLHLAGRPQMSTRPELGKSNA
jgi:hypothetical protein